MLQHFIYATTRKEHGSEKKKTGKDRPQKGGREEKGLRERKRGKNGWRRKRKGEEGRLKFKKRLWIFICKSSCHTYSTSMLRSFLFLIYLENHPKFQVVYLLQKNHFLALEFFNEHLGVVLSNEFIHISQRNRIKNPEVNCYVEIIFPTRITK